MNENLANGNHTLTVYAYFTDKTVSPIIDIIITVDTAFIPPKPSIISPLNQTTYNTKEVPLTYAIDSKIFHSYYSLDTANYAIGRIEFTGNTTLTNLSEGSHKLRLSLETESHSLRTYECFFLIVPFTVDSNQTIPTPTPSPEPAAQPATFPPSLVFVASVGIALAAIGLLVYLKKRHR